MSDVVRLKSVKIGLHASAADVSTFPTSLVAVQPRQTVPALLPRGRAEIERPLITSDGRALPAAFGAKDIGEATLPFELRGADTNTGAAVTDWEAKLDIGKLLASFFGAVAPATAVAAATPTCSGAAGSTLTASTTDVLTGEVVIFTTTTGVFMRRVISGGGTITLTLDRAFTGTASGTLRRAAVYSMDYTKAHHLHVGVDVEGTTDDGSDFHQRLIGCAVSALAFAFPDTGLATVDMTLMPTDWDQPAADNPTYADPTAGAPISAQTSFYDGAVLLDTTGMALKMDGGVVMRPTGSGPNGVKGGVYTNKRGAQLTGRVYLGGGTTPANEIPFRSGSPDAIDLLGGADDAGVIRTTRDLFLQVGKSHGRIMGIWLPAASVHATTVEAGEFAGLEFVARPSGADGIIIAIG